MAYSDWSRERRFHLAMDRGDIERSPVLDRRFIEQPVGNS
jgi:hypothetical protein